MNTKIKNGLYVLSLSVLFFVVSHYSGVDASRPYSDYPEVEGTISSVERLQLENKRLLKPTTNYYEIRVEIKNDDRIFFYRSPHSVDISKYRPKIRKGNFAQIKYQERMDRGMNRIMNLTCDNRTAIPFGDIVREAKGKDRLIGFFAVTFGLIGGSLIWVGIKEKRSVNTSNSCNPVDELKELTVDISHIPKVFEILSATKAEGAFGTFIVPVKEKNDSLNIQFSYEDNRIGLDWVLLGEINKDNKDKFLEYAKRKGYRLIQKEGKGVKYFRAVEGDLVDLCQSIILELYDYNPNAPFGLVYHGAELEAGIRSSRESERR